MHDKFATSQKVFEKGLKTTNVQQLHELQREYFRKRSKITYLWEQDSIQRRRRIFRRNYLQNQKQRWLKKLIEPQKV